VERAVALTPPHATNHANRGRVLSELVRLGRATPEQVLEAYDRALSLDPRNGAFLQDASAKALALGQPERSREYARRVRELYPGR
jgi:hypothetical protein